MPTTLKIVIAVIVLTIIGLISYIVYLTQEEKERKMLEQNPELKETVADKKVKKVKNKKSKKSVNIEETLKEELVEETINKEVISAPIVETIAHTEINHQESEEIIETAPQEDIVEELEIQDEIQLDEPEIIEEVVEPIKENSIEDIVHEIEKNVELKTIRNPALTWQKELLINITRERLLRIQNSDQIKKLDANELQVLSRIIQKKDLLKDWDTLLEITNNEKTYGVLNVAILDHLYLILPKKTRLKEVIKTSYFLDALNDGIELRENETDYLPSNLDVNATLIKILNNDLEIEDRKNKLTIQTVKRACLELISNGGYKDLNWPAKQVICRIILDNIANDVYNYKNTDTMLSDENKIYLRLLSVIIANSNYTEIVDTHNCDVLALEQEEIVPIKTHKN